MDALRNVEVKARVKNLARVKEIAENLAQNSELNEVLEQSDQFYNSPSGSRLKLRREEGHSPCLVWYNRPDNAGPKLSTYRLCTLTDEGQANDLNLLLTDCFGQAGKLEKTRYLYMVGQTRVHIDSVKGLGDFMELEVVMQPDQSVEEGQRIADKLLEKLGIVSEDLITGSYMDLFHKTYSK